MNDDTTTKPSALGTTCRIGPPADERFDEEAFLMREMAEAKAALRRTIGAVKEHAGQELTPQRLLRRHPLATAGAVGVGGLLLVRRILRGKSRRAAVAAAPPAQAAPKAGLLAMLVPSVVAIVQSLSAAKMNNAQNGNPQNTAPMNPQAWMVNQLWGLARERFRGRAASPATSQSAPSATAETGPIDGVKTAGSRTPKAEPMRQRPMRPR
jgi:hypothetical protein